MTWMDFIIGKDFRTSVSALIAAVGQAGLLVSDVPSQYKWIFGLLSMIGTIGLGFSAKDRTSHSTLEQVEEATREDEIKKAKLK